MWVTGRGLGFADLIRRHGDVMDPGLVRLLPLAGIQPRRLLPALEAAAGVQRRDVRRVRDWDLLLMPTMPGTAFAADAEVPPGGEAERRCRGSPGRPTPTRSTSPGSRHHHPCGLAADGLPVGLQIVGPWAHDVRVLDFAEPASER